MRGFDIIATAQLSECLLDSGTGQLPGQPLPLGGVKINWTSGPHHKYLQLEEIPNMEASSPLAAMQPPSVYFGGHCGFSAAVPTSYPNYAAMKSFGPTSFNFRGLSKAKPRSDYFNMQPVRGSSPTASLAADLSQNFHIDQRYATTASRIIKIHS